MCLHKFNNPYFLKFFLICDKIKSLHRPDTYVLDAMCELVRWCVDHPSFNKNNMGSVDKIMKAFYKENTNGEYFYCAKNEKVTTPAKGVSYDKNKLHVFFYGASNIGIKSTKQPHIYAESFLEWNIGNVVFECLYCDLNIFYENNIRIKLQLIQETRSLDIRKINGLDITTIKNLNNIKIKDISNSLKQNDEQKRYKLIGIRVAENMYHIYTIIQYNNVWYEKNTLSSDGCNQITTNTVQELLNKILNTQQEAFNDGSTDDIYIELISIIGAKQSSTDIL